MVSEEEQTKDKGVVLGVGDRRGLKDKIRDIYRRGRTKKGKELRIIPPPEMELTNEITVNSKEEDDDRDASQSKEESDIEIVSSGENRSHRLLDMKLFERLKKHPVLEDKTSKEAKKETARIAFILPSLNLTLTPPEHVGSKNVKSDETVHHKEGNYSRKPRLHSPRSGPQKTRT